MSYLVLARKWRPQDFDQVVGQRPVVRILRNAISRKRVPHAMLFSGVRGVGKTTLARIMAKALNCQKEEGELPCNECDSCREITAGNSLDLHEIDGASNRGIQEIRDLKENIRFLPTKSPHKIIIIDEVHMLTTEAFNALLKTLEEPPAHVIFMFATTEIHKIPVTILSRCQRYELKRVPFGELCEFFRKISDAEEVSISEEAIEMIAREASGSVRDGLSLLDQIFSFGGERMTDEDVREVLGLVDRQVFERLGGALLGNDLGKALEILDQVCNGGADLKRFTTDLLYFVRSLIICRVTDNPVELIDCSEKELAALQEIAGQHEAEALYQLFDRLLQGTASMQYAPHPRLVLEMTFAKAQQSGQVVQLSALISRIDELLEAVGKEALSAPGALRTSEPIALSERRPAEQTEKKSLTPKAEPVKDEPVLSVTNQGGKDNEPPAPEKEASAQTEEDIATETEAAAGSHKDVRRDWDEFIEYVKDRKKWMAPVLKMCAGTRQQDDDLLMKYDDLSDCRVLQQPDNLKILTEFAQDFFQKELNIRIRGRGEGKNDGGAGENEGPQEERRALASDPLVQMTTEIFGGQVVGIRTGPRSRVVKAKSSDEDE